MILRFQFEINNSSLNFIYNGFNLYYLDFSFFSSYLGVLNLRMTFLIYILVHKTLIVSYIYTFIVIIISFSYIYFCLLYYITVSFPTTLFYSGYYFILCYIFIDILLFCLVSIEFLNYLVPVDLSPQLEACILISLNKKKEENTYCEKILQYESIKRLFWISKINRSINFLNIK